MVQVANTTATITLTPHECAECGVVFGLSENFDAARRKDHVTWYCPNGHSRYYPDKNPEEKLKAELKFQHDRAARLLAERDQMEASRRAWKGQATKARNRALAGNCPICGEHVAHLERHVQRQHGTEPVEHPEP